MESRLYKELRDLAHDDATIYHYLKSQFSNNQDDLTTAIALIRQLAKEKKTYFDDAVNIRNFSIVPILATKEKP